MFLTKVLLQELSPNSTIIEARDGKEAVALFFETKPDFVLMDIQMPIMNGYEATQAIRIKTKGMGTPIVALTAGNMEGEKEKCLQAGMNDYMIKPIVKQDLGKLLEKWLNTDIVEEENPDGDAHYGAITNKFYNSLAAAKAENGEYVTTYKD